MAKWPKDNQAALIKFYGDPGSGEVGDRLVKVTPPFKMYYDGKPLKMLSFHEKAAPALLSALGKVWDYYGRDQSVIDKLGISKTAGTYNPRKVRGSATKWSNHAYGAAIDINAEQNGFNVAGNIPLPMIAAFKSEGARWGGDYRSRKDPMHFEFCESGETFRSFEGWLKHYKCPPGASELPEEPTEATPSNTAVTAARTVGVTTAVGTAASQVVSAITGPVAENVEQVKAVIDTSGQVIDVTKQVVQVAPSGFWPNVLAFVQSPKFLAAALIVVCVAWGLTYYLRVRKEREA